MKTWRDLDAQVTDASNEARDNLKYLYTLEQLCKPLYCSDPVNMLDSIPSLINNIQMIHAVSRYYHTSERMTSLFVKVWELCAVRYFECTCTRSTLQVTNQMVTACKQYITEGDRIRVWDVDPSVLLQRLASCQALYAHYQQCFQQSKKRICSAERPFEISEMYVFGKFSSFSRRLDQIHGVIDDIQEFSVLKQSHIEGIEAMANRFNHIVSLIRKKPYNPLDHRKTEFNVDYDDFRRQTAELEEQLCGFMAKSFQKVESCVQSLQLLRR